MISWLVAKTVRHAFRRVVLEAVGVAFPVAMLSATLLYVDDAIQDMTRVALDPVQIEMRAVAKSLKIDLAGVNRQIVTNPGVIGVERFGATNVVVAPGPEGTPGQVTARLIAVDPSYIARHSWVRVVSGGLEQGALLEQAVRGAPGFDTATSVSIGLPGDAPPFSLTVPVGGVADLRQAFTWFAIPYGSVQGDIVNVPRSLVVDYSTFERSMLPVLRDWASKGGLPPFDPGSGELPPATIESHVSVDHAAYPPDPGRALVWSSELTRKIERQATGYVIVADNAADDLQFNQDDATNAKILFLLLGLPGVLVAAGVGLAAASALVESHRREEALLRLRGATSSEIARLAATQAAVAGLVGCALGLLIAVAGVSAINGRPVWQGVPLNDLGLVALAAIGIGALTTIVRLISLWRASRKSEVVFERRLVRLGWTPIWRRTRLDIVAIVVGLAILAINYQTGGLKQSNVEGTTVALAFYVLLAPIAIWLGATLLIVRGLLALLGRWSRPERSGQLSSWRGAALRWLGRRPQTGSALVFGALAVGFGSYVLTFGATYDSAKQIDAQAAMGSDLHITPADPRFTLPSLGPDVSAVSPYRLVPARVGSDRKTILAIDLPSYAAASTMPPRMLAGQGPEALANDPRGVLISNELALDFSVGPGDSLSLTIFPDEFENMKDMDLHVVGVYSSFPPTAPETEMVASADSLPRALINPPDFYLARVSPGRSPEDVAAGLRSGVLANTFTVAPTAGQKLRGLTALNLDGLGRIETLGAILVASLGVAVLGAFLILERRKEIAILRSVGASTLQILTGPALEGGIAGLGSLAIGVPIGIGLGFLAIQVLRLFFTLPPPAVTVPVAELAALALFMLAASAVSLGVALVAIDRMKLASVLKEQ